MAPMLTLTRQRPARELARALGKVLSRHRQGVLVRKDIRPAEVCVISRGVCVMVDQKAALGLARARARLARGMGEGRSWPRRHWTRWSHCVRPPRLARPRCRRHARNPAAGGLWPPRPDCARGEACGSWLRPIRPAEYLYLSISVFPLETSIFLERLPLERERYKKKIVWRKILPWH